MFADRGLQILNLLVVGPQRVEFDVELVAERDGLHGERLDGGFLLLQRLGVIVDFAILAELLVLHFLQRRA